MLAKRVFCRTGAREGMYVMAMSSLKDGARRRRRNKGVVGVRMSESVWMLLKRLESDEGKEMLGRGCRDSEAIVMGREKRLVSEVKFVKAD